MNRRSFAETAIRRRRWWAVGLVVAAGIWIRVNGPVEGRVLLVLSPSHGLTVADLPAMGALVVAALLLRRNGSVGREARRDQFGEGDDTMWDVERASSAGWRRRSR